MQQAVVPQCPSNPLELLETVPILGNLALPHPRNHFLQEQGWVQWICNLLPHIHQLHARDLRYESTAIYYQGRDDTNLLLATSNPGELKMPRPLRVPNDAHLFLSLIQDKADRAHLPPRVKIWSKNCCNSQARLMSHGHSPARRCALSIFATTGRLCTSRRKVLIPKGLVATQQT